MTERARPTALHDDAVEEAYTNHRSDVYGYIARRSAAGVDVEDQVQEVFARLLAAQVRPREVSSWRAMLLAIAGSVIVDHARRRAARGGGRHDSIQDHPGLVDRRQSPHEAVADGQQMAMLRAELLQLDPILRQIVILARFEAMSHREIGARLGMEAVVVSRQLDRAIAQLTRRMAGYAL